MLLPAGSCLLHIGPYKTGSTALQEAMHQHRSELRELGVVYPGQGRRPERAGKAVLGRQMRGRDAPPLSGWLKIAAEVAEAADYRVCLSTEDFCSASARQARRIVADLGRDRVHVVAVARRLDKLVPSQWQERVKSHRAHSYHRWLRAVLEGEGSGFEHRVFWASHDIPAMIARWAPIVGPQRFHVIVTDDSDRGWLSDVFEQMLGLPQGMLRLARSLNPSLSNSGTELVRRLNEVSLAQRWPDEVYYNVIQRGLMSAMVAGRRSPVDGRIPPPPAWAHARISKVAAAQIDQIRSLGVSVIGDLDRLRIPDLDAQEGAQAESDDDGTPETISIDAAVRAVAGTVRAAIRLDEMHRRQQAKTGAAEARPSIGAVPATELLQVVARRGLRRVSRLSFRAGLTDWKNRRDDQRD